MHDWLSGVARLLMTHGSDLIFRFVLGVKMCLLALRRLDYHR